ncbi:MAG TPA: hypothetical protein VGA69_02500 [Nitriliruptorales bacterium]
MSGRERRSQGWQRYPPLAGALAATLLALLVLPSALNVPQSSPTQTLEFAPVPPDEDAPQPPEGGNTASLGLGSSQTAPGDALGGGLGTAVELPPTVPEGFGERPVTKRCVGDPPRQTEDPMAPPCVAYFEGDNFGATYPGVEQDEIRILFYMDGAGTSASSRGVEQRERDRYYDLSEPASDDEHVWLRTLRVWQRYFNERYQTYGRGARFFVYFTQGEGSATVETRRADAIENHDHVRPFAVLNFAFHSGDPYTQEMASRGVMVFGGGLMQPAAFFRQHPGQIWAFLPSMERWADLYTTHVCRRVVSHPVSFSGNAGENGQPRRYGLIRTHDDSHPELLALARAIEDRLHACGVEFAAESTFPQAGFFSQPDTTGYSLEGMARFQEAGVTTVLWAGGLETNYSKAAGRLNYHPEWIVAGDSFLESGMNASANDPTVWDRAWVITPVEMQPPPAEKACTRAYTESDPDGRADGEMWGCNWYVPIRQLFTGIQVAGPRLTPQAVDQGFHAIPATASTDPLVAACSYEPNDYTCVKDGIAMWWDPNAEDTGCYRIPEAGRRYLSGQWPQRPVDADRSPDDPCNHYENFAPIFG